jgi:hypothetical protein
MSTQWEFNDPKVIDGLMRMSARVPEADFAGEWATIEFQPDAFSPQSFTIGIAVSPLEGQLSFRLLTDTSKLQCVYGRRLAARFDEFLRSAEYTMTRALTSRQKLAQIEFETDNLRMSASWPTSGVGQDAVLSRLFHDIVALEQADEDEERRFVSLDTQQVRLLVGNELKRIAGLAYEQIVVDARQTVIVDSEEAPHRLDFNLRTSVGAGSVVSAVYKTPVTVELNLLRADRDLRTYAGIRGVKDLAVFVMTPKQGQLDAADFARVSATLDESAWRLERGGLRVAIFDEPAPLAESILEWARA